MFKLIMIAAGLIGPVQAQIVRPPSPPPIVYQPDAPDCKEPPEVGPPPKHCIDTTEGRHRAVIRHPKAD